MAGSGSLPENRLLSEEACITRRSVLGGVAALALTSAMGAIPRDWALAPATHAKGRVVTPSAPLTADRWLELDLYWFRQPDLEGSVRQFWSRFLPLYAGVVGYRGVILSVAWSVGPVMEWSGDLHQKVSVPTGAGMSLEQPVDGWVDETVPLSGTTEQRKREWVARFAQTGGTGSKRRLSDVWTYADLKRLSALLKQEAARHGIADFKVGMFNTGGTSAYGETAPWAHRHPEAFSMGRSFNPGASLHADPAPLGGLPGGIPEGMPVHEAYATQWGSLSKSVGFDAILLRDSIGLPVTYRRAGPWGPVAPSPEVIAEATRGVAMLVRQTKQANPEALVMMYSNGASAVADWRCNGLDLELIARQGFLDIWIDQSWSGAWNEVGVRRKSFWNSPTQGWTYQLGYLLLHAAVLADTKVRHYPLIETFDAWEDWDVLHSVPERLRWAIWAYSHAAVKMPHGLKIPAGSYISWGNRGGDLLSEQDVQFLSDNLDAALADARQMAQVFGPTLVYAREAMAWQAEHARPNFDIKEWIDEQAGTVMKWPVPILSVTRVEWLPQVQSDLFILQTPSHLAPEHTAFIAHLITAGQPLAIFGDPAHGVDKELLRLAGVSVDDEQQNEPLRKYEAEVGPGSKLVANMPSKFHVLYRLSTTWASNEARVVYAVDGHAGLTLNRAAGKCVAVWDPPELISRVSSRSPLLAMVKAGADSPVMTRLDGTMDLPLKQLWTNTGAPYALVAGVLNALLASAGALHAAEIDLEQTVAISAWQSGDGTVRILAGNLEEGIREDADMSRHVALVVPHTWKVGSWQDVWAESSVHAPSGEVRIDLRQARSALLLSKH